MTCALRLNLRWQHKKDCWWQKTRVCMCWLTSWRHIGKGRKQNEKTKPCLTLQICQFGIQGTCGHQCNAKCQILMVRSQLVPNRHQRRWPLIMHLPNVDMPIGHQHIHLPLRQIDSVGHRRQGQWIDACVRPAFQLLVAEDMSARRSMSMTHWWQSPQAE